MNKTWLLTRALLKNNYNVSIHSKKGRRNLALYILTALLMSPIAIMFFYGMKMMLDLGAPVLGLKMFMYLSCMLNLMMVIFAFPTTFYFSKDNALLLSLPVRPFDIVLAKTLVVFIGQIITILLMGMPIVIAFGLWKNATLLGIVLLFLEQLIVPMILFSIVGLIFILVFAALPKAINRDRFNLIAGIFSLVFCVGFSVMGQMMGHMEGSGEGMNFMQVFGALDDQLAFMKVLFFQVPLASKAAMGNLGAFGLSLLVLIVSMALFAFASKKWYLSSAMAAAASASKGKKLKKGELKKAPVWKTYALNDLRTVIHSPAYLVNVVLGALITPILLIVILFINLREVMPALREMIVVNGTLDLQFIPNWAFFLLIGCAIPLFVGSMNQFACTAISRKGLAGLTWMKTIPLSLEKQATYLMIPGTVFGIVLNQLICALLHIFVPFPLTMDLIFLAANIVVTILSNEVGLITDMLHPKLIWDDETAAIKNNINSLIDLGLTFVIMAAVAICFIALPLEWATLAGFVVLCIMTVLLYFLIQKNAARWLMKERG